MVKMKNPAITDIDIHPLISQRWSPRAIDNTKQVSRKDIIKICEAGRWAPSCFGDEPWRIMVFDKFHNEERYNKAFECLGEWNQKWVNYAPVLMIAVADSNFRRGNPNRWGQYDTGSCVQNMLLQAFDLGLVGHPMGGFDESKITEMFNIPTGFLPMSMIAFGYYGNLNSLDESYHKDELKERSRRPLGENFFDGEWDKSLI